MDNKLIGAGIALASFVIGGIVVFAKRKKTHQALATEQAVNIITQHPSIALGVLEKHLATLRSAAEPDAKAIAKAEANIAKLKASQTPDTPDLNDAATA